MENQTQTTPPNFEVAYEKLQQSVKKLESGELSLEDSLKAFEEGVQLSRVCQEHLTAAEQKVELLVKVGPSGVETKPFRKPEGA